MMTRKDYVSTAEILEVLVQNVNDEDFPLVLEAVDAFAEMFAKDNERFQRSVFLNACGVYALENY
jgi:hypothetical protein